MKQFNSFEEMRAAYPLDSEHNQSYLVRQAYITVFSYQDIDIAKRKHPDGWMDKTDHRWCYYDIEPRTWYDCYVIDGEKSYLGIETWDGIQAAEEPEWGIQRACNFQRTEFGIFKTKAEAINYKNKKLKERLEF